MSRGPTISRILDEARDLSVEFDKLSQAVAERIGLTSTELLALDLISRGSDVTAGHLARELHLTSGAITGLIDRMERNGYARRRHDPSDRRRVFVTATPKEVKLSELFSPLSRDLRNTMAAYSDAELDTLIDFLGKLRKAVAESTAAIRAGSSVPRRRPRSRR